MALAVGLHYRRRANSTVSPPRDKIADGLRNWPEVHA